MSARKTGEYFQQILLYFSQIFPLFLKGRFTIHPNICVIRLDTAEKPETGLISLFYVEKSMCGKTTINVVSSEFWKSADSIGKEAHHQDSISTLIYHHTRL